MTTPEPVAGSSAKSWWAMALGILGSLAPIIAQFAGVVPAPYGAILTGIGGVIALVTKKVVYEVPFKPPNTELVPVPPTTPPDAAPPAGGWKNPYRPLSET